MEDAVRRGQHGKEVEYLQQLLRRAGESVVVDGVYGPRTQSAVARFMRTQGWHGNGSLVSAEVLRRLEQIARRGSPAGPTTSQVGRAKANVPPARARKQASEVAQSEFRELAEVAQMAEMAEVAQMAEAAEAAEDEMAQAEGDLSEPASTPRGRPPAVPGISPDTRHGADLLGVQGEARAFARLICSRRTGTPLSIGLFGDWGSGKSFFMGKLQEEIEARNAAYLRLHARMKEQDDEAGLATLAERWHGRVAQITFNAWHYAEPNLWASMVTRVFDELAELVSPGESLEDTRARLMAEVSEGKLRREQAKHELREAEKLLAEARVEREEREATLTKMRDELAVVKAVAPAPASGADAGPEAAAEELEVGKNPWAHLRITLRWMWTRGRGARIGLIAAGLLVVLGIALLLAWWREWMDFEPAFAWATTAAGLVSGVAGTASAWLLVIRPRLQQTRAAYTTYVEERATVEGFVGRAVTDLLRPTKTALGMAQQRLEEAEVGLESATMATDKAAEKVARAQRELQELSGGRRFYAFVRDRDGDDDYRKHLGLVSMIRQDFARLEEILEQVEREGPSDGEAAHLTRIVLYIDDLDRCEPERVVEVLQAVHLLLATPIFVVVVAVDVRWLRRSLTLHYDRLLQGSREEGVGSELEARPTAKNYLEKIFQIPFSLRPMDSAGFGALVQGVVGTGFERSTGEEDAPPLDVPANDPPAPLTEPPPDVPPGDALEREQDQELSHDRVLALDSCEVEFMKGLHTVIDTPRLAKALVNTYRLLRAEIEASALSAYLADDTYRGVLTLLAIQVGRSEDAKWLFDALERSEHPTLGETLHGLCKATSSDFREARWRALLAAVTDVDMAACPTNSLAAWTARIRRFSFNPWPTY